MVQGAKVTAREVPDSHDLDHRHDLDHGLISLIWLTVANPKRSARNRSGSRRFGVTRADLPAQRVLAIGATILTLLKLYIDFEASNSVPGQDVEKQG